MQNHFFQYWGKADEKYMGEPKWHPLAYHCLDVAAVAMCWWDASTAIRRTFLASFNCPESEQIQLRAWVTFFVVLHDIGKFDIRFQLKAPDALASAWRPLTKEDHGLPMMDINKFDHGWAGIAWANREYQQWATSDDPERERWEQWQPWLAAVTGHHGEFHAPSMTGLQLDTDEEISNHDHIARKEFVVALSGLFLEPAGLSLKDDPPACSPSTQSWLAGFCAICDWIGSNTDVFEYQHVNSELADYLEACRKKIREKKVLETFGLLATPTRYKGVKALLKVEEAPRSIQVEVDNLPLTAGLTLMEAPTGSGKTEAALAYAWRLLEHDVADSIVFALPTQATANAMLTRAEKLAVHMFESAHIVLAHGKRNFNESFKCLIAKGQRKTAQGEIEAAVQCAGWLANSRKRVFLGQIGVCTVDQALLSVLPIRHNFVRGFGLNKSVLIVDEIHAYDAYMHGLLGEVLRRQKDTGGSVILLSATLPDGVRTKLFDAWEIIGKDNPPYPVVWHGTQGSADLRTVPVDHQPSRHEVKVECVKLPDAFPDDSVLDKIVAAAEAGALVAVVMNLVADAQRLARLLRTKTAINVDVFHARYRFMDRQRKEKAVLENYGRDASRNGGRILVATQVVEQSLDLDFDLMVTQICPVDLLFQRLGRLHRHERSRPSGFEVPHCAVMSVEDEDYGLHKLIYGNTRVLWRTEQLLAGVDKVVFPEAYREWIDLVYQREDWVDEPEAIALAYDEFSALQRGREADAQRLTTMTVSVFRDQDSRVTGLTRDAEMSLTVLPLQSGGCLLDGQELGAIESWNVDEQLNLQAIPVPASWKNQLGDCQMENEGDLAGYRRLEMTADGQGRWVSLDGQFRYTEDFGLELEKTRKDDLNG